MMRGAKAWALPLLISSSALAAEPSFTPDQISFFESKIRPVLSNICYKCHSHRADKVISHLYMDSRAGFLKGGDNGPAMIVGDPNKSLLIKAIGYLDNDLQMPKKKKLSGKVIADFTQWIKMGAPWPKEAAPLAKPVKPKVPIDWDKLRNEHWAFRPIANPTVPKVKDGKRVRNPIDAFVLSRLEQAGLKPNAPAPKDVLIRRAYIDLIGRPPTPAQVAAFVKDESPDAFAEVVDELLASPHYGERWARHWLDVARYSDGEGGFLDKARLPLAWRYRDWVIEAFNRDLPYDQFVTQQLAGDLLGDPKLRVAGGFLAVGPTYSSDGGDPKAKAEAKAETLDDRVDTVTRAFLALTVSCARCHDHKFDPIPTADYYSLAGIFKNTKLTQQSIATKAEIERYNKKIAPLRQAEAALKKFIGDQTKAYQEQVVTQGLAKYMLAAVSFSRARLKDKRSNVQTFAKEQQLSSEILGRFLPWITKKTTRGKFKEFKAYFDWVEAHNKTYVIDEDLRALTAGIQNNINAIFENRAKALKQYQQAIKSKKNVPKPKDPEPYVRLNKELRRHCTANLGKSKMVELGSDTQKKLATLRKAASEAKKGTPPPLPEAHFLAEAGSSDMAIAIRGNILKPGKVVPRRFLHIIAGEKAAPFKKGSGRTELAAAIVDRKNPLTARVMINRIWQHHFGRAIVRTPSNFGARGEKPTHPLLLDYLATQFMTGGWSMKAMHRLIMLSNTYQTSSDYNETGYRKDSANRLIWRANARKMEAEAWRDSLLFVTGELSPEIGGEPLRKGFLNSNRRTIYAVVSRNGDKYESDSFLRLFDFPAPRTTSAGRIESIVPQQYLFMMNSDFMINRAKALATRLTREAEDNVSRIHLAYALLFSRKPDDSETQAGMAFLAAERQGPSILQRYVQVLLSTHEFIQIQ